MKIKREPKAGQTWCEYIREGISKDGVCRLCEFDEIGYCHVFKCESMHAYNAYCKDNKFIRGNEK